MPATTTHDTQVPGAKHLADGAKHLDHPLRIGASACLLGHEVRFDGGHKRDQFLLDQLGQYAEMIAVCPEVEVGMGTPRPTLHLERRDGRVHLITTKTACDQTERMARWAEARAEALAAEDLDGYVLKKDSPSCGLYRVKVYGPGHAGPAVRDGRGLFAEALVARLPLLPVEEEGRLNDPRLRENFIERVFAYRRLKGLFRARWTMGQLVAFHSAEKLLLLAHEPAAYTELGRLVAHAKETPREEVVRAYQERFMRALARLATVRRHVNVLQHMAGYFKKQLDDAARHHLAQVIDDFGQGLVPLVVPVTLIDHYARVHHVAYLEGQTYLRPHPKELMLRNHV